VSNYQAIATVTATLSQMLSDIKEVNGAIVIHKPPDLVGKVETDSLNLFLYQVTPNAAFRNDDLPERNHLGELVSKPRLALNLHYLITAYSVDSEELQAQKMLASAMCILHERAIPSRKDIENAITNESRISGSELAGQIEAIRITPQPLSVEEISKLWSSFFQTNYRLSATYQVSVVFIESTQNPKPTLPVRDRLLYVTQFRQPIVTKVEPQILQWAAVMELKITGQNLKADKVYIRFDKLEPVAVPDENVRDNQILVSVPDELTAGIKPVQVIHRLMLGNPESEHEGYESNTAAFILVPKITTQEPIIVLRGSDLTLEFEPAAGPQQKAAVLLGPHVLSIPQQESGSDPVKSLSVKIPEDFPIGEHPLRLRIDGAESFLRTDGEKYSGPKVTVTKP
jgi:hypothetical protein